MTLPPPSGLDLGRLTQPLVEYFPQVFRCFQGLNQRTLEGLDVG